MHMSPQVAPNTSNKFLHTWLARFIVSLSFIVCCATVTIYFSSIRKSISSPHFV